MFRPKFSKNKRAKTLNAPEVRLTLWALSLLIAYGAF